jgi:hypothetical protein
MKKALFLLSAALLASASACGPALATVRISIDLATQRLTAARGGETVVWKISSGRAGYETPAGRYSVMRMEADHYSDEYEQAPMPYAIFFSPRGLAIHGSFERGLGSPRSHGCVRLSVPNAQKLFEWVEQQGATIEIVGATRGGQRTAKAESARTGSAEEERFARPRAARRIRPAEQGPAEFTLDEAFRY